MKQQIWSSSKKKLYDLQYFEDTGIGRAVGPIPKGKGQAGVGSVGTLVEVIGKSELEAFELLRRRIEEKEKPYDPILRPSKANSSPTPANPHHSDACRWSSWRGGYGGRTVGYVKDGWSGV